MQAIEDIIGGGAVQLFQHIISRRGGGETIRLDVPHGTVINLDRDLLRRGTTVSASLRIERASPRSGDARSEGREFDPLLTMQRWGEEVKILHGKFAPDRFAKLGNHVVVALLPAAVRKAKEAKLTEENELAERRAAETKAEEEAKEAEEREAEERTADEARNSTPASIEGNSTVTAVPIVGDVDMAIADIDVSEQPEAAPTEAAPEPAVTASGDGTEPELAPADTVSAEPSSSNAPERVSVLINGSPVDITDTGIDPTFLEALPDDMREEVLNQHVRDQRAARVERPPDSQISSEFLDALPPEIRAEILHQERVEFLRRNTEERAADSQPSATAAAAVDIDPASFIASLDPQLRQDVLMDQDDGFIQSLPSHMIAEAGVYRDRVPRRQLISNAARHGGSRLDQRSQSNLTVPPARKAPAPRDAIQLLDKSGIAVLVRLLFFPQMSKKNVFFKVLVNLCENAKTRTELFNLLLNILQDGTGDLAAIDRSFAQMTFRNSKGPTQTPRAPGKQRTNSDYLGSISVSHLPSEIVPDLIAQRCLEALTFIVTSNELSSLFFLTEHELPLGLRKTVPKKGKGKEKQAPQTYYPIVLLLGLLDRQSLLKTPSILESVVSLLDTVTRPLTSLKDSPKKGAEPAVKIASPSTTAPFADFPSLVPSIEVPQPDAAGSGT